MLICNYTGKTEYEVEEPSDMKFYWYFGKQLLGLYKTPWKKSKILRLKITQASAT